MRFSVNTPGILKEVFNHFNGTAPGICEAMDMIRVGLARISQRAVEIKDPIILEELEVLGCIHPSGAGAARRP